MGCLGAGKKNNLKLGLQYDVILFFNRLEWNILKAVVLDEDDNSLSLSATHLLKDAPPTPRGPGQSTPSFRGIYNI